MPEKKKKQQKKLEKFQFFSPPSPRLLFSKNKKTNTCSLKWLKTFPIFYSSFVFKPFFSLVKKMFMDRFIVSKQNKKKKKCNKRP